MSQYVFKLPDLGEGLVEAEIAEWMVKVGDFVDEEAPIGAMLTDKAAVEIPSPHTGVVTKVHVQENQLVHVGDVMVSFVALDTTVLRRSDDAGRAQRRWLAETLAEAAADWLVVFGHDPILRINGELDPALGPLLPLLHRHGLDLYLTGEEQVLGVQRDAAGALHVASGAGAMVSDPPGHAGMEAHVPRQGFVHVRLEPATLRLRLIDRDGTVHYNRRLQRDESGG